MLNGLLNNALQGLQNSMIGIGIPKIGMGAGLNGGGDDDNTPPISTDYMRRWNKLISFAKDKGYAGKEALDHDENLRKKIFDEYNKANPSDSIPISIVKPIQNEIQSYRQKALQDIQSGKGEYKGSPDSFMKDLSKVDGIFGQRTSQWAFPEAYILNKETGDKKSVGFAPKVDLIQTLKTQ